MIVQERFYTANDLLMLPEDGNRYELVRGELVAMNPPNHNHALLSGRLFTRLSVYAEDKQLGYVTGSDGGYLLHTDPETGKETVRVPDVAFYSKDRKPIDGRQIYVGAPDLAVEVISPSETYISIGEKLKDYVTNGVQVVWLVYPEAKCVEIHKPNVEAVTLDTDAMLENADLLPGFTLNLHNLFAVIE
jgi:Uma2 family endonuclease